VLFANGVERNGKGQVKERVLHRLGQFSTIFC
jgi:hypothetical protein